MWATRNPRHVAWLLPVLFAAGCAAGTGAAPAGGQTVVVAAATKSEAASTFHITATEKVTDIIGTPFLAVTGASLSGDVDLSTSSAHLSGTLGVLTSKAGTRPESFSFETIEIGNQSWDSTSGIAGLFQIGGAMPPGHWVKDDSSTTSVSQFPDPGKLFDALKSRATAVRSIGSATIDGVACHGYSLQGPPGLLNAFGGSSSDSSSGQPVSTAPVTVRVWVDKSGLLRRLSTTLEQNAGPPGQLESEAVTVDFTHYGAPVRIEPPPANLVLPGS